MSAYTVENLSALASEIAALESARAASMSTFLGSKTPQGWTGAGINSARSIAASLSSIPPDNLASQEVCRMHRACLDRVLNIING